MKNICFYFTALSESRKDHWAECFDELGREIGCKVFALFDDKENMNIFKTNKSDKIDTVISKIDSKYINSLNQKEMDQITKKYNKYNLQQLRFHEFLNDISVKNHSFEAIVCALIKYYENFLIYNKIEVLFIMEPQSIRITANVIIMEMVCNRLGKKISLVHSIGGWMNIGIFDNLFRSSIEINRYYKQKIKQGLSSIEVQRVIDFFDAYTKFKKSEWAKNIIYKKNENLMTSIKKRGLIKFLFSESKNKLSSIKKSIINNNTLNNNVAYDSYDIHKNKYVLFLPNKINNKRAQYLAPFYQNQLSIIQNIAMSLPFSHSLVIKDHPHSIKSEKDNLMVQFIKSANNCFYIDPNINTFDVIDNADAIVSIASTSAIEALIKFKHVILFGNKSFTFGEYDAPIKRVTNNEDLPHIINSCISSPAPKNEIITYFYSLLTHTYRWGDVLDSDWVNFSNDGFDEKRSEMIKVAIRSAISE